MPNPRPVSITNKLTRHKTRRNKMNGSGMPLGGRQGEHQADVDEGRTMSVDHPWPCATATSFRKPCPLAKARVPALTFADVLKFHPGKDEELHRGALVLLNH
ncbi:MAG TPA: hypothetical protein VGP89_02045 [Candidatus Angelobacter sp.]|nr:hypothetical protein [Candidatus Angelobacter sp.]